MFRLNEVIKAVGGRLISGRRRIRIKGISIDSRTINRGELFIAIKGNRFDGHNFIQEAVRKGAKAIVHSSRLAACGKTAYIKVKDTRRALGDLARFHRKRFNIPIVAITGSNGKTSTKDMLAWVLSAKKKVIKNPGTQNNEIGLPLALLKLDTSHDIGVLELGTNHLGEIAYLSDIIQPNIGIITNVGPAHLEHLKGLSGVYREKIGLFRRLMPPKIAIFSADDPWLKRFKTNTKNFCITYGIRNKSEFQAKAIKWAPKSTVQFFVNCNYTHKIHLNTLGYANVYNALAVIAVARLFGWDYRSIDKRLSSFNFPPGRLGFLKCRNISFIDDTYNANPASLSEALDVLNRLRVKGRRILVMGDMLELGKSAEEFHRQAGSKIARVCDAFISVGRLANLAGRRAVRLGLGRGCFFSCRDSREAGDLLFRNLMPNRHDLILVKGSRLMKMEEVLKNL